MEYINTMDETNIDNTSINLNKEEFSNNVKQYLGLEEEITKLNIAIRERKKKLKLLQ